jgi:hypothetical protein
VTLNKGWAGPGGAATADDVLSHWADVIDERSARDAGLDAFAAGSRNAEKSAG